MPMSEEERRLLKELELGLIADDPHLAMELLSGYPAPRFRADLFFGALAGLTGLVLLIAGASGRIVALLALGLSLVGLGTGLLLGKFFPGRRRGPERPAG
ncbi:hypothetical protein J2X12_001311 [Pseudarthrobacter oxydans]|uniref:DUF3040 domain-containing protein n=1 Tax=Pseudarthrobacter oxydans TaxID=1671 RepID=A0AAW8NB87_PSEOX|nr:DUF3040 domain-containing protein [Pseudarthrobacter oxydans]MDR6791884.1 hypothetical protein [Pseudarthrobacter oxydans]MDR7163298.1 hypothetical protein [Pseudarthrobacter oxydans]